MILFNIQLHNFYTKKRYLKQDSSQIRMYSLFLFFTKDKHSICKTLKVNDIIKRYTGRVGKGVIDAALTEGGTIVRNRSPSPTSLGQNIGVQPILKNTYSSILSSKTLKKEKDYFFDLIQKSKKNRHYIWQPPIYKRLGSTTLPPSNPNLSSFGNKSYLSSIPYSLSQPIIKTKASIIPHLEDQNNNTKDNKNIETSSSSSNLLKKDYYLPLPELLTGLSGLATLDESLRIKLKNNPLYFKKFATFCLLEQVKILYYFFSFDYQNNHIIERIFKCFSLVKTKDMFNIKHNVETKRSIERLYYLKPDEDIDKLYSDKFISTCQHMLVILCHSLQIDINEFIMYIKQNNIDFTHYKTISINVIIEYLMFMKNTQCLDNLLNIKFIDHTNLMLEESDDIFNPKESDKQTGQSHSDILLYTLSWDKPTEEAKHQGELSSVIINKFYRDVKADYKGPIKGHFTLIPYLYTDLATAEKYMNNYITIIKQKIKENPMKNNVLLRDLKGLTIIRLKIKDINIKEIILDFNEALLDMSTNKEYVDLGINITIASDVNIDREFIKDILPVIEKNIEDNYDIFDIDIFFPKNNKIYKRKYEEKVKEIIQKVFPEDMQKQIMDNYTKFIENGNK